MEKYYLKNDDYGDGVPSIMTFYKGEYPNVVDRYFSRHYVKTTVGENEDHLVLMHSNRLCLIGLAKSHIAFSKGIAKISYDIGNCDRSTNQVKGKHKRGGMNLQPSTTLAIVTSKDGAQYKIASCITGKLLEVNDRLETNPEKLSVEGEGYVAVVLCKLENIEKIKGTLLSEEEYNSSPPA